MNTDEVTQTQKVEHFKVGNQFAKSLAKALRERECIPAETYGVGAVDDLRTFIDVQDYAYDATFRVTVEYDGEGDEYMVSCAEKNAGGSFTDHESALAFILGMRRYIDSEWDEADSVDLHKQPNPGVKLSNGGVVIQSHQVDEHLSMVLCTLPKNDHTPWVTWQFNHQTGGAAHGDYCTDFQGALESFADRVGKLDDLYN